MRVLLAGTRTFGGAVYDMLAEEGHKIAGIAYEPGDPKLAGRAQRDGIEMRTRVEEGWVRELGVDLILGAHSHSFIGARSRAAARLGALGYHPSLLPRHRGRDAVAWTVRMGDPIAGGSVYWFTDNVDGGPIAAQDWCFVKTGWSASDLWREELFPMGLRLLKRTLAQLDRGILVAEPQDEEHATWEPSLGSPPLFRPELPELGSVDGYDVRAHRGAAR